MINEEKGTKQKEKGLYMSKTSAKNILNLVEYHSKK